MRDPRKNLADALHYVDRRSIPSLQHRHQHAATSVLANDVRLWSESITDRRDIPKIDRGTAHRLNGQIVQFLNGFHIRVKVHDICMRCGDGQRWFAPQTNIVRQDGNRGVLVTIFKAGDASTIDVVKGVRQFFRGSRRRCLRTEDQPLADQSIFVRARSTA